MDGTESCGAGADNSLVVAHIDQVHTGSDFSIGTNEGFTLCDERTDFATVDEHHIPVADLQR